MRAVNRFTPLSCPCWGPMLLGPPFPAILRGWLGTNPTTQDLKDALLDHRAQPVLEALL